jgi:transposase
MTIRITLDEAERSTLDALATHHPFGDFRRRALGVLAVGRGEPVTGVAAVLGVTVQSVRHWKVAWRDAGLVGLLGGHAGGRPRKLTEAMLDTAVAAATAEPLGLREIADRVRAAHPEAPPFSLDRLGARLKGRGLSFKRCRLSLKKKRPGPLRGRPTGSGAGRPGGGRRPDSPAVSR